MSMMHCSRHVGRNCTKNLLPPRPSIPVRYFSTLPASNKKNVVGVAVANQCPIGLIPETPIHLPRFHRLPSTTTWFHSPQGASYVIFSEKLASNGGAYMSYELIASNNVSHTWNSFRVWLQNHPNEEKDSHIQKLVGRIKDIAETDPSGFQTFDAPLSLIILASQFNKTRTTPAERIKQLYIAQSNIRDLPPSLIEDLPTPDFIKQAGKGDIYGSSIWLGLQPTYTPLHRDPNPNLFCQLVGSKVVRLMPPRLGESVYADVRRKLGVPGNSRFRGAEMMHRPEREAMHRAVWAEPDSSSKIEEAFLEAGDSLFIPKGWWHSVASVGEDAELNASANWWFR
ncbi:cupin-like domain-containing protein [Xylariaceae sp. FL0255]|nr:cupin-like domain-containing protein [Xylariaceae sp. FL0255]